MPASLARLASSWPTWCARAFLSPVASLMLASRVDADASVWPAPSSMSWAKMCRADLFTASRGRAAVPVTFLRTRTCRRFRDAARAPALPRPGLFVVTAMSLLPSLPDLAADLLAGVTHALALVGVGLAELTYVGGDLADLLLVDPLHDDPGGGLHPQGDAIRRGDRHRVAVAERELHPAALGLHPVPDADDLQRLAVPVGDAGHHVGDQSARQAVQRPDLALIVGPDYGDDAVGKVDLDGLGDLKRQGALGPLDGHRAAIDRDIDALRYHHREPSDS